MGMTTIVFGAADDEAAAAVLELEGQPEGYDCYLMPDEVWELEGLIRGVAGSELPTYTQEPVAETDDFAIFVMPLSSGLAGLLRDAVPARRDELAERWQGVCPHVGEWASYEVEDTLEILARTLVEIQGAGLTPYMYVCP